MWNARTKDELMIEVWEKLDCESVGRPELEAIEVAVEAHFGKPAVDSPMVIARLLADEGAHLRHSEVMELYLSRISDNPYDAALRTVLRLGDLRSALSTIRDLENLRRKFNADRDKEGLRQLRETALRGKSEVNELAKSVKTEALDRQIAIEISQWLSLWLQTPELFEGWVAIRQETAAFRDTLGQNRRDQ